MFENFKTPNAGSLAFCECITMCHAVLLHCYSLLLSIDNGYVSFFIKYKRMATILSLELVSNTKETPITLALKFEYQLPSVHTCIHVCLNTKYCRYSNLSTNYVLSVQSCVFKYKVRRYSNLCTNYLQYIHVCCNTK